MFVIFRPLKWTGSSFSRYEASCSGNDATVFSDPDFVYAVRGIFRHSVTVHKLLECIDLAGNLVFRFQNFGFVIVIEYLLYACYKKNI
jgi:hypothetical protein